MIIPILKGLATYIPGLNIHRLKNLAAATPPAYYYSVWLRHLILAQHNNLKTNPNTIAELGPGGALGIGLMALLCGADRYVAFDVVAHTDTKTNLHVFDQLLQLLEQRSAIPADGYCKTIKPRLTEYAFPAHILTEERLEQSLHPDRIRSIRESLIQLSAVDNVEIRYYAPWYEENDLLRESVDMLISQAVLEHVDNLEDAYTKMNFWLKPSGYISHQIDFKSHGTAATWDGHWTYTDKVWQLIRGKRAYLLNRRPFSHHLQLLHENGFEPVYIQKVTNASKISRDALAPQFTALTDEDLQTSGAFIQAVKA